MLLVVLVTCRSASTSISPPSARRRKQHEGRQLTACALLLLLLLSCAQTPEAALHWKEAAPTLLVDVLGSTAGDRAAHSGAQTASQPCRHQCSRAFHPLDFITPCFSTRLTTRPHPRPHIPRSARSQSPLRTVTPPTSSPPPRAHPLIHPAAVVVLSRARPTARNASAYAPPPPACACPRAYRKTALAATAPGRVQRHWRVNRRHKGPQKTATRRLLCDLQNPVKARRDGMLVASSATIYTCNGFWYNQPSCTERFRCVLLPARCMRRSCQLVSALASLHLAPCANVHLQPQLSLQTYCHSLVLVAPNEPGRQTNTPAQSAQKDTTVVRIYLCLSRR